jgi:TIR domain
MKNFDIFLSYHSRDAEITEQLRDALKARGVRVWLDKDQIRPGDLFLKALGKGLATSRAVGFVITADSQTSKWVEKEYYRAESLSISDDLQLIGLLFGAGDMPAFLKDRNWIDFRSGDYDQHVDRLIWPGITDRKVLFVSVYPGHLFPWADLGDGLRELGCEIDGAEDIRRAPDRLEKYTSEPPRRVVVVVDIFEGWPERRAPRNTPREYVDFIFQMREKTKGTAQEVVFVLHHNSRAFARVKHKLPGATIKRLLNFFTFHSDMSRRQQKKELKSLWFRIQKELLKTEH